MIFNKGLKTLVEEIYKEEIEKYKQEQIKKEQKIQEQINIELKKDVRINFLETQLGIETSRINNLENDINNIRQTLSSLAENIRMNNAQIEADHQDVDWIKSKLKVAMKKVNSIWLSLQKLNEVSPSMNVGLENTDVTISDNAYQSLDYFGFENYFRGSREKIKEVQAQYLPYFKNRNNVIDLGCGRGEFLELLKEHQISGKGVDFYPEFVEYCNSNGLSVEVGDAIEYLKKQKKVDGIFAGQLIEHLSIGQIIEICELSYEKLEEGSFVILETPNPQSLAIYTNAFYIDPSHQKPVHPLTMQYLLRSAGFDKIEIYYTDSSRVPFKIPELKGKEIENLEAFNQSMQMVSDLLYGSQDYAIIAQK